MWGDREPAAARWRRVQAAPAGEDGAQMCLARLEPAWPVGMVVPQERLLPEVGAVVLRALEHRLRRPAHVHAAALAALRQPPRLPPPAGACPGTQVTRSSDPTLRAVGGVPGRLPGRYR